MKKLLLIPLLTLVCSVMAWAGNQAKIVGGDEYATLAEAVAAASANDEVQLLENVTLSAQLDITKAMTLNLNGRNITLSNAMIKAFQYGNLTISGTGTIHRNETSSSTYALRADSVTLTIESATVEGGYFSLGLFNGSHGIVGADATIQTISGSYGAVYINHTGTSLTNNGTIISTVNQGTINSGSKSTGTITNNGTITATSTTSNTAPVRVYGTLTNSGTITSATTLQPAVLLLGSNAAFNMTGGSISGVKYALGLTATNNTLNISGGEIRATGSDGQGIHTNAGTNSIINITGGSIYGGPYGPYTGLEVGANMADPIRIRGNCTLTIDGEDALIQGNNFRSVAIVNTNGSEKTTVYLKNGTLKGGLFNSGLMMDEKNLTTVYMTGGQILNIEREDERKDNFTYLPGVCHFEMSGGYIEGAAGIGIKSGTFIMTGGTIKALDAPQIINAWNGGMWSAGGALQIESNKNYSGNVNITISSGELISEQGGCAIYEFVEDANDPTVVSSLSVTGGRFQGGVNLSQSLTAKGGFISGGKWSKDISAHVVIGKAANPISEDPYFFEVGNPTTATEEKEPETGKTAVLVNASASDSEIADAQSEAERESSIATTETNSVVISENTDVVVAGSNDVVAVKKVTIEDGNVLTVKDGATLNVGVGAIHLDEDATSPSLVVEDGATLMIDGLIYGANENNFVIETSETKIGSVLFSPETEFIKEDHPMATVKMLAKQIGKNAAGDYYWHRFAMPVDHIDTWTKDGDLSGTTYPTYLYGWDYANNDWKKLNGVQDMVPLQGYTLTLASDEIGSGITDLQDVTYTFKGNLVGNANQPLNFQREGFNFFGNSYTGYMDVLTLIQGFTSGDVEGTVYMWCNDPTDENNRYQSYEGVSLYKLQNESQRARLASWQKEVAPMQTFILRLRGANSADEEVDYASAIWGNPRYGNSTPSAAPKRVATVNDEEAYFEISVKAVNGKGSRIDFTQDANHNDAFESGYDVVKYMNENTINLYATLDGENLSSVVTNALNGKLLSLQTNDEFDYTMSFKNVEGEQYAVLDHATNQITLIAEGNTYPFVAQPNSTIEGRFEIVNINRMPTDVETVENAPAVHGIYTVTGQYVGENLETLPKGVYVIDGVKVVK